MNAQLGVRIIETMVALKAVRINEVKENFRKMVSGVIS